MFIFPAIFFVSFQYPYYRFDFPSSFQITSVFYRGTTVESCTTGCHESTRISVLPYTLVAYYSNITVPLIHQLIPLINSPSLSDTNYPASKQNPN